MDPSPPYILHHYDASPFSEKVRLMFGIEAIAWRSVVIPTLMPKPDLIPLTGGYRRTPVMQIGADIFCDTQVILAEIVRRKGSAAPTAALSKGVNFWADRLFFQTTVPVVFAELGEHVPKAFIEDREKMSGRAFDVVAMKAAATPMQGQWRAQAAWIEGALATGGADFLDGPRAGPTDVAAYLNIWFLGGTAPAVAEKLLTGFDRLAAWRARLGAIGHGSRTEMTGPEALAEARDATPGDFTRHDPADPLPAAPGDPITVFADDYGSDPVSGVLVAANAERVVLARDGDGPLHVHFPRAGYIVRLG
ncbi:MAG: glutathione S-transferase N-terminal domain-containing protein [Caulobacteraceae bacterium]